MRISDWSSDVCSSDLRGAGRVKRVVDAILAFLDLDFGRAADLDHGHTAGELGETLLELLAIVIAGGVFDLGTDRFGTALDRVGITGAIDERGVVLVDRDALGGAEPAERDVFELDPQIPVETFALSQTREDIG